MASQDFQISSGRLAGKRAFVTAAGHGIGRATAMAMAREGARVIATDIDANALADLTGLYEGAAHRGGGSLTTALLDVRDGKAITEHVPARRPDILFNCAGMVHTGTILDATEEEWAAALNLNISSMFYTIRAVLPGMVERGGGSIINMSSVVSSILGVPDRFIYGTSKAAVIGLTKSVARDFVTQGIRCNAICPGTVDTPSLQGRLRASGDYEVARAAFIARQPIGRLGTVEEVAALAVYLASDETAFTTGQIHIIDGGWTN